VRCIRAGTSPGTRPFEGEALARVLAMIMVAMAAAPGFSPLLGGATEEFIGWRMTFMGVSALGLALVFWYAIRLAETHATSRRRLDWMRLR
jgi:DHA1 family bicyclomycin/chloramphenicol resistance-like MFS transporter